MSILKKRPHLSLKPFSLASMKSFMNTKKCYNAPKSTPISSSTSGTSKKVTKKRNQSLLIFVQKINSYKLKATTFSQKYSTKKPLTKKQLKRLTNFFTCPNLNIRIKPKTKLLKKKTKKTDL